MSTAIPERPTVLDTTVLSNFAYLDRVGLLHVLTRPVTPPTVRDELLAGAETYPFLEHAADELSETIPVVPLGTESEELCDELTDQLDRGEAEAFAIAECHDGLLVTDDGPARDRARERDVQFTGSIGVLITLVDEDEIDDVTADTWLKQLIDETDYRAPSREFSEYV